MTEQLYNHLSKFVTINAEDFPEISSYFRKKTLHKKEIVLHAGRRCRSNYFVLSGCLRTYCINDKGVEQTLQFGLENWWITDFQAFYYQRETDFYIQAVENAEILCLDYHRQQELFEKFPQVETYFRIIYQIAYGATITRFQYIFTYSKEEIFFRFRDMFPEFVQRVPQYLLASYLGLTPEYLSEIKSKRVS